MNKNTLEPDVTVVIGVQPLPGTHRGRGADMGDIVLAACAEAKMLYDAGIRSIMLQNPNDQSYDHRPERMAFMTAVACAVKGAVGADCQLGISIIPNDTADGIAVAKAAGLSFVRAKVYVGVMIRTTVEFGTVAEALNMKDKIDCDAEIWADVHDRMGAPLGDISIVEACGHAVMSGADRLIVTGKNFDETVKMVGEVKAKFSHTKVLIGGSVEYGNLKQAMNIADGVIIATSLKRDGKINNGLDKERLLLFMQTYNAVKAEENK